MLDFLGIGSRKAGTTWTFKRLAMHPETYFPLGKETHYWDKGVHSVNYVPAFKSGDFVKTNGWKCGEITPSYAIMPSERIAALKGAFPDARVFIIARNPVDRTMSNLKRAHERGNIARFDIETLLSHLQSSQFLSHSSYDAILSNWRAHYDLKVLLFDDIETAPKAFLACLCRHIGISDRFFDLLPDAVVAEPVYAGARLRAPPELARWIAEKTESDIKAVERATGRDLSHWRCSL